MNPEKRQYSCFRCDQKIVTIQIDEGTMPHIIADCIDPECQGPMKNDYASTSMLAGARPTHRLIRRADAPTDKLVLEKVKEEEYE